MSGEYLYPVTEEVADDWIPAFLPADVERHADMAPAVDDYAQITRVRLRSGWLLLRR